jgi:hypothetical protein
MARLANVHFISYKRFTDLTITGIPESARLIVLAGPNGSGKSSIFDGFRLWHAANGSSGGYPWDESYGAKVGTPSISWPQHVILNLHGGMPDGEDRKRLVYIRTAFRNEPDFNISSFSNLASPLDVNRIQRLIDNDMSVSDNFQRLIMETIRGVYDDDVPDSATKKEIRERIIGKVQEVMGMVFPDLILSGISGVAHKSGSQGTFLFTKGVANGFLYKNLSAGEKASFDLILDGVIKSEYYTDTLWCIDEPETHLNTRVQGALLSALMSVLPDKSQLLIATHSLGFMRRAWEMAKANPAEVCFLDMQNVDFDKPAVIEPTRPDRNFWTRTLDVAMGDLAMLVAPERIVLCEGRPPRGSSDNKAEFDASCYRVIFADEMPDTDFLSVGNSHEVSSDRLEIGRAIQALAAGTNVIRLIDRDMRTENEVADLASNGIRVLSRRHIESYLLDDEVLAALCMSVGQAEKAQEAIAAKMRELGISIANGNDSDDLKSAAGAIYTDLRRLLTLTRAGSGWNAFARDVLAPLMKPGMIVYESLKQDIFGT